MKKDLRTNTKITKIQNIDNKWILEDEKVHKIYDDFDFIVYYNSCSSNL